MNGQGKLLTHFLKNADKLVIPVYQRNYDWKEEHCKKLYSDLVKTIRDNKRWHFFGGIVSVSDPTIVHQMIECVKMYPDGRLDIIFGGGYLIEERLEKES